MCGQVGVSPSPLPPGGPSCLVLGETQAETGVILLPVGLSGATAEMEGGGSGRTGEAVSHPWPRVSLGRNAVI